MRVTSTINTLALSAITRHTQFALAMILMIVCMSYNLPTSVAAADGDLDLTFGTDGRVVTDFPSRGRSNNANAVAIQSDGKIIGAGSVGGSGVIDGRPTNGDFALTRYNADGSLDSSFGTEGRVITDFRGFTDEAFAVAIQSDGKIVAAGGDSGSVVRGDFLLARYNADGSLDESFGTMGRVITALGYDERARAVAIQDDGKIVAAGYAASTSSGSGSSVFALARYNSDGTLDESFGAAGKVTTNFLGLSNALESAVFVATQADGKLLAAGSASSAATGSNFALARYNPDGTLDETFGTDGKVTTADSANAVAMQSDGKLVAAGSVVNVQGSNLDFALARYNPDGTLDETFGTAGKVTTEFSGLNDGANAVALQADGRIVAAGYVSYSSSGIGATSGDFALARYEAQSSSAAADLALSISAAPEPVTAGALLTYSITLTNTGPAAAESVNLTDILPDTTSFVSCTATEGGVCAGTGNSRTVTFATLAPGASATITLVAQVKCSTADGTIVSNTASVSAATADPEQSNNSAAAAATVSNPPELITVQDESTGDVLSFNSLTGDYTFSTCDGNTLSGSGQVIKRSCRVRLVDIRADRVVRAFVDVCAKRGQARVIWQEGASTISDADTTDNDCPCP